MSRIDQSCQSCSTASRAAFSHNRERHRLDPRDGPDQLDGIQGNRSVKDHTVLLPTGTLEPHGVVNNGADNTAPTAMAKTIARADERD